MPCVWGYHSSQNTKRNYHNAITEKSWKELPYSIYLTTMKKTPLNQTEGAKAKKSRHSSKRWIKIKEAIDKASDNGRCWWIEQYLRKTL